MRTKIQIRLSGSPEACRQGAVLETGIAELEVECLPRDLPERIVVDVEKLGANEAIHVRDIKVPEGVKVLTDADLAVAMVKFAKEEAPAATDETADAAPRMPLLRKQRVISLSKCRSYTCTFSVLFLYFPQNVLFSSLYVFRFSRRCRI